MPRNSIAPAPCTPAPCTPAPGTLAPGAVALALALAFAAHAAPAQVQSVEADAGPLQLDAVVEDLAQPWGMAFLPDGRLLVTELVGDLRIVTFTDDAAGEVSDPIDGTPEVFAEDQGGLMDVALDPDFDDNAHVWLSFAEAGEGGASTALGRGRLVDDRLEDFQVIFRQEPKLEGTKHFGSRIAFAPDGAVFLTLGERFEFDPAQDLSDHLGAIVRLNRDGSVPDDNPHVGREDARPEIWSHGHRNIQAAAFHPSTGELWIGEMGPRDGDELNRIEAGANYGWPEVSWGMHYDGREIPDPPTRPEFVDAVTQWTPVISPAGMIFYEGDLFSDWQGDAFLGGLTSSELVRVRIEDGAVTEEERIPLGANIRNVAEGPDGAIYVLTRSSDRTSGDLWRITPQE